MKNGLIYWFVTVAIYGSLLALFSDYFVQLSYFYHFLILIIPLSLLVMKKETIKSLGLVKGDLKTGLQYVAIIVIVVVASTLVRAWIFDKPVYLMAELSWLLLLIVIIAPITEELFLRGYLQTKFEKKLGKKEGLILASALFSLIHLPKILFANAYLSNSFVPAFLTNPIISLIIFFGTGAVYGYIYQETKSIRYSIAIHAIVNFVLYFLRF